MVMEMWAEYVNDSDREPCVGAFIRWVMEKQPELLKLIGPVSLTELATEIVADDSSRQGVA
jgi:hypothetical protein